MRKYINLFQLLVGIVWLRWSPLFGSAASTNSTLCLSGSEPFQLATTCAPGWYCPLYNQSNPATYPVQCAPTNDCLFKRLTNRFCEAQGVYEPTLCAAGFYCPTATQQLQCPEGTFCPIGQYQPIFCGSLNNCPAGSQKKWDYSSLVAMAILDGSLLLLWLLFKGWNRRRLSARADSASREDQPTSTNTRLFAEGALYHQLPPHSKRLCQGFKRAQRQLPAMRLEFDRLSLTIPAKSGSPEKTILAGITGTIEPGKVTAIMGPSGAGKTMFLNSMLNTVDSSWVQGGSLKVNGVEHQLSRFRKIIGYVPQEDIMVQELSVYDNISYSGNIRLPRDWTAKQRRDHIVSVIAAMQLAHVQNVQIGDEATRGVSGGQRKRVNIGMEIAAAPSLLILDEPTSGLDSTSAMEICQLLTDLARVSSLTVVMVIHQPRVEIWNQLDELLLLAPGGLTVYQGPQRLTIPYFVQRLDVHVGVHENPADALMDRIAVQGGEFAEFWKNGGKDFMDTLIAEQEHVGALPVVPAEDEGYGPSTTEANDSAHPLDQVSVPNDMNDHKDASGHSIIQVQQSHIKSKSLDHSHPAFTSAPVRHNASFMSQLIRSCCRSLWKQVATLPALWLEIGLGTIAGAIMGAMALFIYQGVLAEPYTLLSPSPIEGAIGQMFFFCGIAISLAAASAGVRVFSEERVVYRREVAAGHSHLAYYIGVSLAQAPRLFLCAFHFALVYHVLGQPTISFGRFLPVVFFLYSATYGLAAIVSMIVARTNAALLSVVLSLLFASMTGKGGIPEAIQYLSASRWAAEALFGIETAPFIHIMRVFDTAERMGYVLGRYSIDVVIMFSIGICYRVIAYGLMRWSDRRVFVSNQLGGECKLSFEHVLKP